MGAEVGNAEKTGEAEDAGALSRLRTWRERRERKRAMKYGAVFDDEPATAAARPAQPALAKPAPVQVRREDMVVFGVDPGTTIKRGPYESDLTHTFITGMPKSGKTTLMLHLILEHISRGESVVVLEPHHDLIPWLLSTLPRERWKDVVYINPLTAYDYGSVVQINFLRWSEKYTDSAQAVNSFIEALHRHYTTFWGPRLDQILRYALHLVWQTVPRPSLKDLHAVLTNSHHFRDTLLERHRHEIDEEQVTFWQLTYPAMPGDAHIAVLTKMAQLMVDKFIMPFTVANRSSVDFRELMDTGKIVLIDLVEGKISREITDMLGSFFLAVIYQAGMSRVDLPPEKRRPCWVLVDEAHRFTSLSLPDALESLRKYSVFLTLATQNSDQFETPPGSRAQMADIIMPLCSTKAVFKCSEHDARRTQPLFAHLGWTAESLMNLHEHSFAFSTVVRGVARSTVLKTIYHPRKEGEDITEAVLASVDRYGVPFDAEAAKRKAVDIPVPIISPCEHLIAAHLAGGSVAWSTLADYLSTYGIGEGLTRNALNRLINRGFACEEAKWTSVGGRELKMRYVLTSEGYEYLYPYLTGARAGGIEHTILLSHALRRMWKQGLAPVVNPGGMNEVEVRIIWYEPGGVGIRPRKTTVSYLPDAIVYRPERRTTRHGGRTYQVSDAHLWNRHEIFAIEVETDPSHHIDRVIGHYKRALDCSIGILFVVPDKEEAKAIMQGFERHLSKSAQREIPFPRFVSDITREPDAGNVQILVIPPDSPIMERQATQVDESLKHEGLSETYVEFFKKRAEALKGGPPQTAPPEIKPSETQPEIQPPETQPTGETPAPQVGPPAQGEPMLLGKRDITITPTAELGAGKPLYPSEEEIRDRTSSEKTKAFEQKYKQGVEKTKRAIEARVKMQRIEDARKSAAAAKKFEGLALKGEDVGGVFEPRAAKPSPHAEAQPQKTQPPEAKPAEAQQPAQQPETKPRKKRLVRHRTNLNTIRSYVNKFFKHGDYWPYLRSDNVVQARRWNPETKKMECKRIGVFDEDVKRILSYAGIVLKGRKLCYKKPKK